jgi:hypothetical protein
VFGISVCLPLPNGSFPVDVRSTFCMQVSTFPYILMSLPSLHPFHQTGSVWWSAEAMKFLIIQFSSALF